MGMAYSKDDMRIQHLERENTRLRSELTAARDEAETLKNRLAVVEFDMNGLEGEVERLRGRVSELEIAIEHAVQGDPDGICDEENWDYAVPILMAALKEG